MTQENHFAVDVDPDDALRITLKCLLCGRTMPRSECSSTGHFAHVQMVVEQHRCTPRVPTRS
jgi:hypothetical protein